MASTGLVLEGGGMRGAYTAGVLDAFLDIGVHFKDIIGVSAGAANSISYISGQYGRNKEVYHTFAPKKEYLSLSNFIKTGSMFGMKYVFFDVTRKYLPFDYDAFKNSDKKLTIVATNIEDGKAFYKVVDDLDDDHQMLYLCASAAIPMASTIVDVDGHRLMDGGASDSIPIEYSMSKGNEKNVVVVTRNKGYRAKKSVFSNIAYLRYPRHRQFAHTVANRFGYYNRSLEIIDEQERQGNAIVFYPSKPIEVTRFEKDPGKMLALYQNGYDDGIAMKERLYSFLESSENVDIVQ